MKNKLNEAFDNVSDEYVTKSVNPPEKKGFLKYALIATALALVVVAVSLTVALSTKTAAPQTVDTDSVSTNDTDSVNTNETESVSTNDTDSVNTNETESVITNKTEPETTVEPFVGNKGNYAAAKFMSVADTSPTAQTVFGGYYTKNKAKYRESAAKLDAFFDRLTKKMLDGEKSGVVSPVNIYMALALLAECTGGTSRTQILDVLGVESIEELREMTKLIWLYNSRDDKYGRSVLANSIWLTDGLTVNDGCVDTLNGDYYASLFSGDFKDANYKNTLKQWLSDQTNGLLDHCINELTIPDETLVALVSTLYYKTKWNDQFYHTENGVFRGKNGNQSCVFNIKTTRSDVYKGDGFTAYCESLSDGNNMWFFLPDDGKTVSDVLNTDLVSYIKSDKEGKYYLVTVRMPDFDVDYNETITGVIKSLGIVDCTNPAKADFTSLTDEALYLDSVVHAARFKADKDGVEGAAFTVEMVAGASPELPPKYDFDLKKPFAFMVSNGGVPLFTGVVNEI